MTVSHLKSLNLGPASPALLKHWSQIHFLLCFFFIIIIPRAAAVCKWSRINGRFCVETRERGTQRSGSAADSPRLMLCERLAAWERGPSWPRFWWDSERICRTFESASLLFCGNQSLCAEQQEENPLTRCIQFRKISCKWPGAACGQSSIQTFLHALSSVTRARSSRDLCTCVIYRQCQSPELQWEPLPPCPHTPSEFHQAVACQTAGDISRREAKKRVPCVCSVLKGKDSQGTKVQMKASWWGGGGIDW